MSKASKFSLLISCVALIAYAVSHVFFGGMNLDFVTLGAFVLGVVASIGFDRRLWAEFLTMRTTKHGMNMGLVILLMVSGVVCVNYLALKHNKTWDLTTERLNSLSEQSTKLLDGLKDDLKIKLFYRGSQAQEQKQSAQGALNLFKEYSGKVKVSYINALVDEEQAITYLKDQPDVRTAPAMTFVEYGTKRIRVEEPIDESQLTAAIIRATRTGDVTVYFVKGHGERDLTAQNDLGLSEFGKALKDSSFKLDSLDLVEKKAVPADAALVAIIGPTNAYLEDEIQALRAYARRGGHLFVALDPGQHHNLANLTKPLGIEFTNTYILSPRMQIQGGGPATIVGRSFDPGSPITSNFPPGSSFAVFPIASELKAPKDNPPGVQTHDLVKSDDSTLVVSDPRKISEPPPPRAATLGMSVSGKGDGEGDKEYEAVVFGDSDFLTNRALFMGVNRDLALNAFAQLANQKDLISIKPKLPAGTQLTLTGGSTWLIVIVTLMIPLVLFITSLVIWFRRRGA